MHPFLNDLRFGLRTLKKRPGFTLVAIATLALGIGANTAIFSVVQGVLLDTVPFDEPEELIYINEHNENFGRMSVAYPNFLDWRERNRAFDAMAAHRFADYNLTGDGARALNVTAVQTSAELFSMLGVEPLLGRTYSAEEDQPGSPKVAVLSHGLWQSRFGGREDVLGQELLLDAEAYEIIGVLPADFLYPLYNADVALWLPIGHFAAGWIETRGSHPGINVTARLADGVSYETGLADLDRIAVALESEYPDTNTGNRVAADPLHARTVRNIRPALLVLTGAVGLVLLIACVNVANLLLARGAGRAREMAVRNALGAGRWQMARQCLVESLGLALLGGIAGVGLGYLGLEGLLLLVGENVPAYAEIELDGGVLAFTLGLALLTGLLFGLAPAWQASRANAATSLKEGAKGSEGRERQYLRGALVIAEVALALVLLIGATLFVKSFSELLSADAGVDTADVLTFQLGLPEAAYPEKERQLAFYEEVLERVGALPGVSSAATTMPLFGGWQNTFTVEGREPPPPGQAIHTEVLRISPRAFEALGMRLVKGRTFTAADRADSLPVAIIDERFAAEMFPGEEPLGKRVKFGTDPADDESPFFEIVGVVNHVKSYGVSQESRMQLYRPLAQDVFPFATAIVKTSVPPRTLLPAIEAEIQAVDPDVPVSDVTTLLELTASSTAPQRLAAVLLGLFAVLAMVLSAVGIYGVIAYSVTQRQREIGIRMALGARAADVVALVVGQGLRLAVGGVALGLALALALAPLIESQLFGVTGRDPATYVALPIFLALVAILACAVPARRASRVEPVRALHHE